MTLRGGNSNYESLGAEYHKEVERLLPRMLFFAVLILLAHTLTIRPADFDAGGIKIAIADVSVVHGGLAIVFLFHLYQVACAGLNSTDMLPFSFTYRSMRARLNQAGKRFKDPKTKRHRRRTPQEAKRYARWSIVCVNLFVIRFALVFATIIILAACVAVADLGTFAGYLSVRLEELEFIPSGRAV